MVKTVMDGRSVAHVWAQQSQPSARSHNGNLYFDGATLYSYGSHFAVGQFIRNAKGERAVLLNSRPYSTSTSKHQGYARNAVHGLGLPVFRVPGAYGVEAVSNLAYLIEQAGEYAAKAKRARVNGDWYLREAAEAFEKAKAYAAFTGQKFKAKDLEGLAGEAEATRKREAERVKRELAIQRKRYAAEFETWRAGGGYDAPRAYVTDEKGGAYLRVVGDELQTSQGARVPLDHAVKAFRFVKLVRQRGKEWHSNGSSVRVGHFTVTKISAKGDITAGCHFIRWPEIEYAARQAGVFDAAPSEEAATHA